MAESIMKMACWQHVHSQSVVAGNNGCRSPVYVAPQVTQRASKVHENRNSKATHKNRDEDKRMAQHDGDNTANRSRMHKDVVAKTDSKVRQ